jgi:hypothetical protein
MSWCRMVQVTETKMIKFGILSGLTLILTACGGNDGASNATAASGGAKTAAANTGWNPLDACTTLGKDAAGEASGSPVTGAELSSVVEGTDATAAFSMCTFKLANGGQLMLLTREAPFPDATAESIEKSRTADGTLPPATDVPGLGRAAMWSDQTKGLQVFLNDTRYVSINYYGLPAGATGKDQAVAVAKKLL